MLTAYHPCRLPLVWAVQQLGFDTDQQEEVRGAVLTSSAGQRQGAALA